MAILASDHGRPRDVPELQSISIVHLTVVPRVVRPLGEASGVDFVVLLIDWYPIVSGHD